MTARVVESLGLLGLATLLLLQRHIIQNLRVDREEARRVGRGLARQNRRLRTWQRKVIANHPDARYHLAIYMGELDPETCRLAERLDDNAPRGDS